MFSIAAAILIVALVSAPEAQQKPPRHSFSIQYDYRFAGECAASPGARRTLESAAGLYERLILNDFPDVPAGTQISIWNAGAEKHEVVVLSEPIDDVLVFVFCANWPSDTKAAAAPVSSPWAEGSIWEERWIRKPFQPWVIRLTINALGGRPWFFDPTPESDDDLPSRTHYDLYQSVLHELGHGLGLIRNESPIVFTSMVRDDMFLGPSAMRWNGGQPVPLAENSSHVRADFNRGLLRPNLDRYMMHGSDIIQGFRAYPKALDLAMLKDIGYRIDSAEEERILALSLPGPEDPRKAAYRSEHPDLSTNRQRPAGLWYFDNPRYWRNAIVGRPLRYMPPDGSPVSHNLNFQAGAALIPRGGFFIVDHGMPPNGGGREVNQYSLLVDIQLPKTEQNYGLYNTSYNNAKGNPAKAFIDTADRIGQGNYSSFKLRAGQWYRVVITVDIAAGKRSYYVDGIPVLTQAAGERDGRHSIGAAGNALFCLFADGNNDRAEILVKSAALYPYALPASRVQQLGKTGDRIE